MESLNEIPVYHIQLVDLVERFDGSSQSVCNISWAVPTILSNDQHRLTKTPIVAPDPARFFLSMRLHY
jgi:hypothetical protein